MTKRTASKKPAALDWHPADIKAALEKAGWSLRRLSAHSGLKPGSLQKCLQVPWPRAERLIAESLGEKPQRIWPSRYCCDGTPKRGLWSQKYTKSGVDLPARTQESAA